MEDGRKKVRGGYLEKSRIPLLEEEESGSSRWSQPDLHFFYIPNLLYFLDK
jgi:hypothetical protein